MPSPFYGTSARYGLRKLLGTSNVNDIDAGFAALADDVDTKTVGYSEGVLGARPAAGIRGRVYLATNVNGGTLYFDTGSAWLTALLAGAWQALTLVSGITATTGLYVPSARLEGDLVRLKGGLTNTSGSSFSTNATLATAPGAVTPSSTLLLATSRGVAGDVAVNSTGTITIGGVFANGATVELDGMTYTVN